jgi:hypothetical protein
MLIRRFIVLALVAAAASGSSAQTPAPAASQTRLQKLELTYQDNLRKVQAPLLQQYLTELKALQAKAAPSEAAAIEAEIAQVQKLVASGGLVDLLPARPDATDTKGKSPGIVFTLDPHEARPPQVGDAPVPVGEASWSLSRLPAGNYDLIAHYACPALPPGATIEISFGDEKVTREIKPSHITLNGDTFRVMRLGRLKVSADTLGQAIVIKSSTPGEPWLFIRQALIVKAGS